MNSGDAKSFGFCTFSRKGDDAWINNFQKPLDFINRPTQGTEYVVLSACQGRILKVASKMSVNQKWMVEDRFGLIEAQLCAVDLRCHCVDTIKIVLRKNRAHTKRFAYRFWISDYSGMHCTVDSFRIASLETLLQIVMGHVELLDHLLQNDGKFCAGRYDPASVAGFQFRHALAFHRIRNPNGNHQGQYGSDCLHPGRPIRSRHAQVIHSKEAVLGNHWRVLRDETSMLPRSLLPLMPPKALAPMPQARCLPGRDLHRPATPAVRTPRSPHQVSQILVPSCRALRAMRAHPASPHLDLSHVGTRAGRRMAAYCTENQ